MVVRPRLTLQARFALAVSLACGASYAQEQVAPNLEAPTVEVVGTTPVPGLATPVDEVPANVQVVTGETMREKQSVNLPDFMQALPSVFIQEVQNNPFQPNLTYRGFLSSPLLGSPQGLSVFQDGVRINEPFGDVVNYDLIPLNAISTMTLIPGSNPVFGLNTLGGAIELRTKSGVHYPGFEAQASGGSFGRKQAEFAWGGYGERVDYFIAGNWFDEDGWRDFSPTEVRQAFAKIGWEDAETDFDLSITHADTDLTGNGVLPESMLLQRRDQIFTYPDNTRNDMTMVALNGSHWMNEKVLLSGLVYHRSNKTKTLNGDGNDDFEEDPALDGAEGANGGLGFNQETAVSNRSRTDQDSMGVGLQTSWVLERNTLAVGVTHDRSESDFQSSSQVGIFNPDRSVLEQDAEEIENILEGKTDTSSVYFTDTFKVSEKLAATVSGRFNHTNVKITDQFDLTPPNLDGDHSYSKFNPAIGFTYAVNPALATYAGWNQGSRAPSPIELGCADPANPCTLPAGLASDPFLEQVVAQTIEFGVRGRMSNALQWNAGAFRTVSKDDILFVGTSTSAGFFTNFGKTQRQGLELGVSGDNGGRFRWDLNYSYVDATFESSACLLAENNSSRGTSAVCTDVVGGTGDDLMLVSPGNKIPGIPEHQVRLSGDYKVTDKWIVGGSVVAFSDQYAHGNENNQHQAGDATDLLGDTRTFQGGGKVAGYAILNITTRYQLGSNWELFGRVNNVFDDEYSSAAILAENPFDANGVFQTNSDNWARETFFAPGAPRAFYVGVKYALPGQARR
jgi:outer membrane receptor protein involved in Fe transport